MAKTPEIRAAESLTTALDSQSLNAQMAANLTYNSSNWHQREKLFNFAVAVIDEFANDNMMGYVSPARAEKYIVAAAMIDAMHKEGYELS